MQARPRVLHRQAGHLNGRIAHVLLTPMVWPQVDGNGSTDVGEPWADEVTSVLLALVLLSHKHYLQDPLLPE